MSEPVTVEYIAKCIARAGFNPGEQLWGYLLTGNQFYITRLGNARELITQLDSARLEAYVENWKRKREQNADKML